MHLNCYLMNFVSDYLPPKSKIMRIEMIDLDCDYVPEIAVTYYFNKDKYFLVLKNYFGCWHSVYNKRIFTMIQRREIANKEFLYAASINTAKGVKWGYINDEGQFIIKPIYSLAEDFQPNGLAAVQLGNVYGLIDNKGNYIVKPKYDSIYPFSEGRASVVFKDKFKVINEKGQEILFKGYDNISEFQNGRALYGEIDKEGNYLYGYLDKSGMEVIPAKLEQGGNFKDNKAVAKFKNGKYAIIGLMGEVIKSFKYPFVGEIGDGLLSFKETNEGKYGYIDEDGNVVIAPQFTTADTFKNQRSVVNNSKDIENKMGLIDKKGKYIIPAEYNDIQQLEEEMASIGRAVDKSKPFIGSKYAVSEIDSGRIFGDFQYYNISNYKEGVASAYDSTTTFFIDKAGKKVTNLPQVSGSGTLVFQRALIKADIDRRVSYLNKTGKAIWSQNTIIPLNLQYSVREIKYKPNVNYLVYYPEVQGMTDNESEKKVNNKLKVDSKVIPISSTVQLDYTYTGEFNIEFYQKNLLVLELIGYQYYLGAAHGLTTENYKHIDLISGVFYQLKDFFKKGSNYVKILSDIILKQIKTNKEYSYVWLDSYKGIKENQPFYVSKDNLYIYFDLYEIAPYAAGFPTFKIPYKDIQTIIDQKGDFWRAFN